jgi:hypothetical protein
MRADAEMDPGLSGVFAPDGRAPVAFVDDSPPNPRSARRKTAHVIKFDELPALLEDVVHRPVEIFP